jgi:hypothetical protein
MKLMIFEACPFMFTRRADKVMYTETQVGSILGGMQIASAEKFAIKRRNQVKELRQENAKLRAEILKLKGN